MAKQKKKVDIDLSELATDAGLTVLKDSDYAMVFNRLPTFIAPIDKIFGGGLPFGRMVEISGKSGGGKSTLSFHIARVGTALNCIVILIDVEGTADRVRLEELGIDTTKVMVKQPENENEPLTIEDVGRTIEQSLEVFSKKFPGVPIIFIWDSVGITLSEVEEEKDYGEPNVAAKAKAITQLVSKIGPKITHHKALFIGINQVRDDVGGNPMFQTKSVPGGNAWEHYASMRLEIKKKKAIKESIQGNQEYIGHDLGIVVKKSKVSRPFQEVDAYLISDNGIDYEYNLVKLGEKYKVIDAPSTQSYAYTDLNGEIHKTKRKDFIENLRKPEFQPLREEIMNRLIAEIYPEGHPALKNETISLDGWMDRMWTAEEIKGKLQPTS